MNKLENVLIITESGTVYEDGGLTLNEILYEYTKFVDTRDYVRFVYTLDENGKIGQLLFNNVDNEKWDNDGQAVIE